MVRPDGVPVLDPFDVVPHPIPIDDGPPCRLHDAEHPAIHMSRDATEHPVRRRPEPGRPTRPHHLVVAADAARGHDHGLCTQLKLSDLIAGAGHPPRRRAWLEDRATRAVHHPTRPGEAIDAVPELQRDDTVCSGLLHPPLEWGHHARAGPPGDVKTRNGVTRPARTIAATLRPTNDREEANAFLMKPGTFLARGEATYASAHFRGHPSSGRSKPAVAIQSFSASSWESRTPSRRCSAELTRKRPPNDQYACPPNHGSGSCSTRITRRPASASSAVATSPARPAPTTITSASSLIRNPSDPSRVYE